MDEGTEFFPGSASIVLELPKSSYGIRKWRTKVWSTHIEERQMFVMAACVRTERKY